MGLVEILVDGASRGGAEVSRAESSEAEGAASGRRAMDFPSSVGNIG